MKKIITLYEIRIECASIEEYSKIKEFFQASNLEWALFEEQCLFIQIDHLDKKDYDYIKKFLANFQ